MSTVKIITGGVCSAKGFRAAGVAAEIKYKGRNDVALLVADAPCAAAAVFTVGGFTGPPPAPGRHPGCSWRAEQRAQLPKD